MKLVEKYLLEFGGNRVFETTDSSLIYSWKSFGNSGRLEFSYSELARETSIYKLSNKTLDNYGWFLLILGGLVSYSPLPFKLFGVLFLVLAALVWVFNYMKKLNYEVFRTKSGNEVFGIRSETKEGKEFIQDLKNRLTQ